MTKKEKKSAYMIKWRKENRDRLDKYNTEWAKNNPLYRDEWRKNNKDKVAAHSKRWQDGRPREDVVYFAQLEGWIKIGYTSILDRRIAKLSSYTMNHPIVNKGSVDVLGTICGGRELEVQMHEKFKNTRHGNTEWFKVTPEILEYINDLK